MRGIDGPGPQVDPKPGTPLTIRRQKWPGRDHYTAVASVLGSDSWARAVTHSRRKTCRRKGYRATHQVILSVAEEVGRRKGLPVPDARFAAPLNGRRSALAYSTRWH